MTFCKRPRRVGARPRRLLRSPPSPVAGEHDGHRQLFQAISRLADETGDGQLKSLFHSANSVHINFYDGLMNSDMVEAALSDVAELVAKLERIQQ